jgi:hypothetical protein
MHVGELDRLAACLKTSNSLVSVFDINSINATPNSFTVVDNLQWSKGKHNLTFGIQTHWIEDNDVGDSTPSGPYSQTFTGAATANGFIAKFDRAEVESGTVVNGIEISRQRYRTGLLRSVLEP